MGRRPVKLLQHYQPDPETVAYRVAALIDASGKSSAEISLRATGSVDTIRDFLRRRKHQWPRAVIVPLAKTLGVTAEYLLDGEGGTPEDTSVMRHQIVIEETGPWFMWNRRSIVTYEVRAVPSLGDYVLIRDSDEEPMHAILSRGPYQVRAHQYRENREPLIKAEPLSMRDQSLWVERVSCYLIIAIDCDATLKKQPRRNAR